MPAPEFHYQDPFPLGKDETRYKQLTHDGLSIDHFAGQEILRIAPDVLSDLAHAAMRDVSFMLRTDHLKQVAAILDDPQASENDRFVALALLRNAEIAAKGLLPFCQDTGTATVIAKKGQQVWTGADDAERLSHGIFRVYTEENLRYSHVAPLTMYEEKNTGTNLPAQIDIYATGGTKYEFLFVAKGGGSASKTYLYQETKAVLNPGSLERFLVAKMATLGTAGCPPYHLAFVVGGTSAEACLKIVKLASTKYLDTLPTTGNAHGRAFRDLEMEAKLLKASQALGFGAQFGGKYYALDVRVVRLPRHGAICPIGMGVSCSADRNIKAKIDRDGVWIEQLETDPGRLIPDRYRTHDFGTAAHIDLRRPMKEILSQLTKYPVTTRLTLTGPMIVARDIAHAKLQELIDGGGDLPQYFKDHPVYYAGPAKTPKGMPSGSFGPTTSRRMDPYVDGFQKRGGSMVMIAKGNRGQEVVDACRNNGGFYLGSIGGPAALLAQENIKKVELIEFPELGMEAIYRIDVENFPAFILIDDKGNDFFQNVGTTCPICLA